MKQLLFALCLVACGGKTAPAPTPTPGSAEPAPVKEAPACSADADCGEGKKCNACPPNACQKSAEPGRMCPAVCGAAVCEPAT
jgi:hypothetical protein